KLWAREAEQSRASITLPKQTKTNKKDPILKKNSSNFLQMQKALLLTRTMLKLVAKSPKDHCQALQLNVNAPLVKTPWKRTSLLPPPLQKILQFLLKFLQLRVTITILSRSKGLLHRTQPISPIQIKKLYLVLRFPEKEKKSTLVWRSIPLQTKKQMVLLHLTTTIMLHVTLIHQMK